MSGAGLSAAELGVSGESCGLADRNLRGYGRRGALAGHEHSGLEDRREVSKSQGSLGETAGLERARQNVCGAILPLVSQKEEEFLLQKSTDINWRNHFKKVQLVRASSEDTGQGLWQGPHGPLETDTWKRRERETGQLPRLFLFLTLRESSLPRDLATLNPELHSYPFPFTSFRF